MALPRIDRMTEPPVAGRPYLVPCVRGTYWDREDDWPVIGPEHEDADFFNFPARHYHVDGRFLTRPQWQRLGRLFSPWPSRADWHVRTADAWLHGAPLASTPNVNAGGLPAPVLRRRLCSYAVIPYPFGDKPQIEALRTAFSGRKCARGKSGWICPHRKARLGSIAPVDGVVTCPLHGLRIDATTGVVLPPPQRPAPEPEPPPPQSLSILDLDEMLSADAALPTADCPRIESGAGLPTADQPEAP